MLRQGPLSPFLHGAVEYVAGIIFVAAPFLFGFESDAATAASIVIGIGILVVAASSEGPTGLAKVIPVAIHVVLDFAVVVVLIAAPFLFGFSDEGAPTAFFIVVGVAHLLVTIATRFLPARESQPRRAA